MEVTDEKLLLTVADIRKMTGLGRDAVYEILHSAQFPVMRIGRRMYVHKEVFEMWLKGEKYQNKFLIKKRR